MLSLRTRHPEKSTDGAEESASRLDNTIVDDINLARRLGLNQAGALENLIEQHGDHLQRLIRKLCGGACSADDLMQETLLRAWEGMMGVRGGFDGR